MLGYNRRTQTVVQPNVFIIITTQIAVFFFYSSSACGLSKCCCRTDNALVHEIEIESVFTCDSCPENESPEVVRSHQNGTIVGAIERIR